LRPDYEMPGKYDEIFPRKRCGGHRRWCGRYDGGPGCSGVRPAGHHLLEARPWLGGFFDFRTAAYSDDIPMYQRARELAEKVEAGRPIRVFKHCSMVGAYSNNLVTGFQVGGDKDVFTERYVEIRSDSVIVGHRLHRTAPYFRQQRAPRRHADWMRTPHGPDITAFFRERTVFQRRPRPGSRSGHRSFRLGMKIACVADIPRRRPGSRTVVGPGRA
jgi:sarcosine oxidase subunit alpha